MTGPVKLSADKARALLLQCKLLLFAYLGGFVINDILVWNWPDFYIAGVRLLAWVSLLLCLPAALLFLFRLGDLSAGLGRSRILWVGVTFIVAFAVWFYFAVYLIRFSIVGACLPVAIVFSIAYSTIKRVVRPTFAAPPGEPRWLRRLVDSMSHATISEDRARQLLRRLQWLLVSVIVGCALVLS
jgi:hypothetical protein